MVSGFDMGSFKCYSGVWAVMWHAYNAREKKLMLYYSLELLCDRLTCGPHNSSMLRKGSMTMTLVV